MTEKPLKKTDKELFALIGKKISEKNYIFYIMQSKDNKKEKY